MTQPFPDYRRLRPSPPLAPYIECYWTLRFPRGGAPDIQQMPADGRTELIFNAAGGSRRTLPGGEDECDVQARSFILGARSRGYLVEHFSAPRYIAVRFRPGGLAAFTRLHQAELADRYVELDCLWNARAVRHLEAELAAIDEVEHQVRVLETALFKRLNPPDDLVRLIHAAQQLGSSANPTIAALSDALYLSRRHTERLFARYIGFRPSLFARVVRFQNTLHAVNLHQGSIRLSQLAQESGYFDQAHFNRDFKQFSGIRPQDFFAATDTHQFVQITSSLVNANAAASPEFEETAAMPA